MLLKTDELNVLNITKKKLMTLANGAECLSAKFLDNWVTNNNNNYRKLKSSRIPRSCQTMLDHPPIVNMSSYWTSEDTVLLENWMAEKPEQTQNTIENKNLADELTSQIEEPCFNSLDENILCQNNMENSHILQPIIKMEGDILEIEYFIDEISDDDSDDMKNQDEAANYFQHDNNNNNENCKRLYVPDDNSTTETYAQKFSSTTPTRLNHYLVHNTPKISKHKVADNRGLSPRRCQKYKEFLVKNDGENNLSCLNKNDNETCTIDDNDNYRQNEKRYDSEKSSKSTNFEFDEHRPLSQNILESYNKQKNNLLNKEESIMYERGGSARIRIRSNEIKSEIKSFLSFRCPNKKNRSDKKIKKKYVISEEGAAGPIWPAVLLTYDRGVSPGIPENDSEAKV